jgi:hypothetical protein
MMAVVVGAPPAWFGQTPWIRDSLPGREWISTVISLIPYSPAVCSFRRLVATRRISSFSPDVSSSEKTGSSAIWATLLARLPVAFQHC